MAELAKDEVAPVHPTEKRVSRLVFCMIFSLDRG